MTGGKGNKRGAAADHVEEAGGEGDAGDAPAAAASQMTFEQQMQLLRCQAELSERRQKESESRERELRLQLELAQAQAQQHVGRQHGDRPFDVHKASVMLPACDEREVELYLSNFEKTATISNWPKEKWAIILQSKLSGKALKAFERLSVEDFSDYDKVKQAILDELELSAEIYRSKFRGATKRLSETYSDFATYLSMQYDRWLKSCSISEFEELRQLHLIEQFCERLQQDVKVHVAEKKLPTLNEVARATDEYAVLRKNMAAGTRAVPSGARGQGQGRESTVGANVPSAGSTGHGRVSSTPGYVFNKLYIRI
jgi:hypothetical protein